MPSATIITPLHNGEAFVAAAIRSVLAQTFTDFEMLVVDNQSTDAGPDIVRSFDDPRVRLLSNPDHRGPASTRNVALAASRGRYIAFLDADDLWHPRKLELQISHMSDLGSAFSWAAYDVIDVNGTVLRTQRSEPNMTLSQFLAKKGVIGCLTAVYDANILGPIPCPDHRGHEDFVHWAKVLEEVERLGHFATGLQQSLASYRSHGNSVSANKATAALMHWRALRGGVGLSTPRSALLMASYAAHALSQRSLLRSYAAPPI